MSQTAADHHARTQGRIEELLQESARACRDCGVSIYFARTINDKTIPIEKATVGSMAAQLINGHVEVWPQTPGDFILHRCPREVRPEHPVPVFDDVLDQGSWKALGQPLGSCRDCRAEGVALLPDPLVDGHRGTEPVLCKSCLATHRRRLDADWAEVNELRNRGIGKDPVNPAVLGHYETHDFDPGWTR